MPLIPFEDIQPLLRCPRCRSPLASRGATLACGSAECALSAQPFPEIGGRRALVDFEQSVLTEAGLRARDGTSPVARAVDNGRGLRALSSPGSRVTTEQARRMADWLSARTGRPRLLIVGGGTRGKGTPPLYETPRFDVVAFDIYASPEVQFVADAHRLPLADGAFDAVWIQAVLEHVLEPAVVVAEIGRVLAPGGRVYAETPFLQHVHEGPWDFTRFTESGHRWLFRDFALVDSGVVAGPAEVWLWATEMLTRGLTRSRAAGKASRLAWSWIRVLDRVIPRAFAVDGASCVYFLGEKSDVPLDPEGAIRHYAGAQRSEGAERP